MTWRGISAVLLFALAASLRADESDDLPPKPARFQSWGARLDYMNQAVPRHLGSQVDRADRMFVAEGAVSISEHEPKSNLRLGVYFEARDEKGWRPTFDPDFEVDVSLPNLQQRWKIFLQGAANDELPGVDPTERNRGALVGIRKPLKEMNINLDAGVKVKLVPDAFAKAEWRPEWHWGLWLFSPRQRVYVESTDGFGEVTSFSAVRWFGPQQENIVRSTTAAKWTEKSDGVEWEHSVLLGRVQGMIDERKRGRSGFDPRDALHGHGVRYSIFGHDNGDFVIDRHRVSLMYRLAIYKRWIFFDLIPEVEWRDEQDWKANPGIRLGFDACFWGDGE